MDNEFSNNPGNISHTIGTSTGLVMSKMLCMHETHAKIYIHANEVRELQTIQS